MRYFEVEFSDDNTIDRSFEGSETDCSICVTNDKEFSSFDEAYEFCKSIDKTPRKYIISITEITKEEACKYYDIEIE